MGTEHGQPRCAQTDERIINARRTRRHDARWGDRFRACRGARDGAERRDGVEHVMLIGMLTEAQMKQLDQRGARNRPLFSDHIQQHRGA